MSRLDPVLSRVGYPGPGVLDDAALLEHLDGRLGGAAGASRLSALLDGFERQGLAHLAASWVSTAPNLHVSPAQIQRGLGDAALGQIAHAVGLTRPAAAAALAVLLPHVIDRLTPSGEMPVAGGAQPRAAVPIRLDR